MDHFNPTEEERARISAAVKEQFDFEALLTAAEVATWLRVTPDWIRRAAQTGNFPAVRLGRQVRFRPEDVRQHIEELSRQPPLPRRPRPNSKALVADDPDATENPPRPSRRGRPRK